MFQTQEKFRKHFYCWQDHVAHILFPQPLLILPQLETLSKAVLYDRAFSTIHKLGRWQGGLPRSECQKPGNQLSFLLLISLSSAALHPSPLPFPAGKTSCLFMHFMTAPLPRSSKKKCKEGRRPLTEIPLELMLSFRNQTRQSRVWM